MHKKIYILILVLIFSIVSGCVAVQDSSIDDKKNVGKKEIDLLKEKIESMSLEEKIGQMVMVGIDSYEIDNNSKNMIEKYHVGGFILFEKNIKDSIQLHTLINSLKETNAANKIPLFLSIDEEGGRVSRMPEELIDIPSSKRIGQLNNADISHKIGNIIGEELKVFGLNMDFAPVLDINSNPKNLVIGDRAFGANEDIVSKLGIQTMKGLESQNIISVVKHFPGHGDTSVDSHIGLPLVNNDIKRLNSFELVPFFEAIKNKVDAIMIAHILLPKIDHDNPASFSKAVITDILRTDMNFNGVVITDDMTMGAILENYDIGEAAVKSVNAGSDIILVCHEHENQIAVINALKEAAEAGVISIDRIDQSVYRILKLKEKYGISDELSQIKDLQELKDKIEEINNRIAKLLNTWQ